ncbi:Hypothetical protein FKW44_015713 [Caligus rogercresseyi]|uniref:Uncharacterized protein n=1 Tax=Caligus rogercresseyi TaxID=217165 RepID=A0A7T8K1G1_CALRO|nr:Hypothetical protein FKW44_015713 [Caligus rogercresseyi]
MSAKDIVPENAPSPPETESISNEENDPLTSTTTPSGAAEEEEKCAHIEEEQTEPFDNTQNIVEDVSRRETQKEMSKYRLTLQKDAPAQCTPKFETKKRKTRETETQVLELSSKKNKGLSE